jgi:hypothetical protein
MLSRGRELFLGKKANKEANERWSSCMLKGTKTTNIEKERAKVFFIDETFPRARYEMQSVIRYEKCSL